MSALFSQHLLLFSTGMQLTLGFIGIIVLLGLSGLISGTEVAFFSLTPNDYEEVNQLEGKAAKTLLAIKDFPRRLLATILISNNFINIAIILISELLVRLLFPGEVFTNWAMSLLESAPFIDFLSEAGLANGMRFAITIVGVTFLLVLFGEVAPKVYASYNKIPLALFMARPLKVMMSTFKPVTYLLVNGASVVERRLENHSQDSAMASQQEIDEAIDLTVSNHEEGSEGNSLHDVGILKRIVQFGNVTVRQVMRSRVDVIAVEQGISYHELLDVIREHNYSRIPVFQEGVDQVVGLLYVKDLLGYRHEKAEFNWRQLVREEILYVPESKKVSDLLKEFQLQKMHLAIVVDEYGGTEGIVTLEDVLEEVIGDIQDEFDEDDEIIYEQIDDLNYIFEGKTLLNDVCRVVGISTSSFDDVKGEAESFAGLLLEILGQFPEEEQELTCGDYRFKVVAMSKRRVEEVLITLPESEEELEANS